MNAKSEGPSVPPSPTTADDPTLAEILTIYERLNPVSRAKMDLIVFGFTVKQAVEHPRPAFIALAIRAFGALVWPIAWRALIVTVFTVLFFATFCA